jgi:hypothetical protein
MIEFTGPIPPEIVGTRPRFWSPDVPCLAYGPFTVDRKGRVREIGYCLREYEGALEYASLSDRVHAIEPTGPVTTRRRTLAVGTAGGPVVIRPIHPSDARLVYPAAPADVAAFVRRSLAW